MKSKLLRGGYRRKTRQVFECLAASYKDEVSDQEVRVAIVQFDMAIGLCVLRSSVVHQ